jgi:tripartite-type tricarboxylate transporter receptor subunit TctC
VTPEIRLDVLRHTLERNKGMYRPLLVISVIASAASPSLSGAQDYPTRTIRLVTPGTGGSSDFSSRLIAPVLSANLGQQVIVDNRPTGPIPGEIVSKAPPDGYTLLLAGSSFVLGPLIQKTPYDPVRDFAPISLTTTQPNVLVIHPSLPVKSVRELIAFAKARPGALNYSMAGIGSSTHLAAELFKSMAGIDVVRIEYKGAGAALADLVAGQVQLNFATGGSVATLTKTGRLKALAVSSALPSALFPGLPTIAASGLPGYETVSNLGILAPARTPEAIINRLHQEVVRVLNTPDMKERFLNAGTEVVASTPGEFARSMKSEIARMGKVIADGGFGIK